MSRTADLDSLYENNSGQGKNTPVPREIQKWNWGALVFNWVWGIGNNTAIALLCFVPFVGFVMPFVLGAKGSEWAWQNRRWRSISHFQRAQRNWAVASAVIGLVFAAFFIWAIFRFSSLFDEMGEISQMAEDRLRGHPAAIAALGEPMRIDGLNSYQMNENTTAGNARLEIAVSGPLNRGTFAVRAIRGAGDWEFTQLILILPSAQIDLLNGQ